MQEIAKQFKEELHELLSRYKRSLSNTQIISVIRSVTRKQIGFKEGPIVTGRFSSKVPNIQQIPAHGDCVVRDEELLEW